MSCAHCEKRVEEAVLKIGGVSKCKANAKKGEVIINCNNNENVIDSVKAAITDAGYTV